MKKKNIIVILDTNFIIENMKNFINILKKLSSVADVYIPRVVMHERFAQKHVELKKIYDKIESVKKELSGYCNINENEDFEKALKRETSAIMASYTKIIGNNIIEYDTDERTLGQILDRAYNKIPPFVSGESDRGLKDTLLWLSVMGYFKTNGETEQIYLITKDGGFLKKNADVLEKEFNKVTKKKIMIKDNEFYKELLGETERDENIKKELNQIKIEELKTQMHEILKCLLKLECEGPFGNIYCVEAFKINPKYTVSQLRVDFDKLNSVLEEHIFNEQIYADRLFSYSNQDYQIDFKNAKRAAELYDKVKNEYPDYINQFLNLACDHFNENYDENMCPF